MPVTRDEVVNAYRYILGRYPESENVVEGQAATVVDFDDLRQNMLKSPEFAVKYASLIGDAVGRIVKGKEISVSLCELEGHDYFWCCDSKAQDDLNRMAKLGVNWLSDNLLLVARQGKGCFLDIGANIGGISLALAACGWKGYAVEASDLNCRLLSKSVTLNDFDIKVINKGIWSQSGKLYFKENGPWGTIAQEKEDGFMANGPWGNFVGMPEAIEIDAVSLNDLLKTELKDCEKIDFIKIDVEGSEVEALLGANELLKVYNYPPILVEANVWALALVDDKTNADLIRTAESYGYQVYRWSEGVWKKYRAYDFWDKYCTDYMLVHPDGKNDFIPLSAEAYPRRSEDEIAKFICNIIGRGVEGWGKEEINGLPYQHVVAAVCTLRNFPGLAARGRLCGVDALEGGGIRAVEEQECGARLCQRVELLTLPRGHRAEPVDVHVLVREAADLVVSPQNGYVAGAGAIGRGNNATHEVGTLDGRLQDKLLPGLDGRALAHQQGGIAIELVGEGLGGDAALLVGHGDAHGAPPLSYINHA